MSKPNPPSSEVSSSRLLSIDTVCMHLGCGRTYVHAKMKTGELRAVKLGSRTMVPQEALDLFINSLPAA